MMKMRDDDAVYHAQVLANLKYVGEEVYEVIILFPEYAPTIANVEAIEE